MNTIEPNSYVVIEQPSFFSWYGYFGLIAASETFVFYDDVQFERRSWQSRNRILNQNADWVYINVPTVKAPQRTRMDEICISYQDDWIEKLLSQLQSQYKKTAYYKEYIDGVQKVLEERWQHLVDLDIALILHFCDVLDLKRNFLRSSSIPSITGAKTDRLINIMTSLKQKKYLSSTGAKGYLIPSEFSDRGMELYWYEFHPEPYEQNRKDFVPYMSILDLLFHVGEEKARDYIVKIADQSVYKA